MVLTINSDHFFNSIKQLTSVTEKFSVLYEVQIDFLSII
jgi:hypothetical protein